MSNSCVITNEEGWYKKALDTDLARPKFAIMNPELTMTLPDYQTACGCTDILMHTMERYFTNGGNMEITDSIAEGLMRTVIENARILVRDPKNYDARAEVMWAGSLSHNGLTGCGAVVGMAQAQASVQVPKGKPVVALTMAGVTTPCVMGVKQQLDAEGYETIVCHTNVIGSEVVDELAQEGKIQAVLDITTHEWGGFLFDGLMKCGPERFSHIYNSEIPLISLPGCIDVMLKGPYKDLPAALQSRAHYAHTPFHTHLRTTEAEMYAAGKLIAEKHNLCRGKNAIIIPQGGYSMQNRVGHVLYDAQANAGFEKGVRNTAAETVECITTPAHINDPACIDLIVQVLNRYMKGTF